MKSLLPGLGVVAAGVAVAVALGGLLGVSALVIGVISGIILANTGLVRPAFRAGFAFSSKRLLRSGVVLLGLQISLDQVRSLGLFGAATVVAVVLLTFAGVQLFAWALGLPAGLGLLTATGFSICGTSAVAAMAPVSEADADETAYAVGLVTLCGTLSIITLPLVGHLLGLSVEQFGAFAGAGVHDVGQVTATAAAYDEDSVAQATLVKLARVVMLAPMVAMVGVQRRRRAGRSVDDSNTAARPPLVPLFVIGFLAAVALRSTGVLSDGALDIARDVQRILLTAGLFSLGAGVEIARLRRLGGRPLVLGLGSWVIIAGLALGASYLIV